MAIRRVTNRLIPMWPLSVGVVGRDSEVDLLRKVLHGVIAGHGQAVLVEGEPGAGKSTLLDVAAVEAARLDARVLRSGAPRSECAPAFSALGTWFADAPELAALLARADGAAEFVVAEAILELLDQWSAAGPLALLVDDLHRADRSSLLVLARLGHTLGQLPVLLAGGYQPTPRRAELEALLRSLHARGAVTLTLGALPEPAVHALASELFGGAPDAELSRLLGRAGGNPLYLMELMASLVRQNRIRIVAGAATLVGGDDRPPGSLTDLMAQRLHALPPHTRDVLRDAAILGPRFDIGELSAVVGAPVIELWQPVSDAVAAGLLTDSDGQLAFRHEVIRAALAADLTSVERAALQVRAGHALAAAGAPVERVAQHLVAGAGLDPDAREWLASAADALTERAPALAVKLLDRALGLGAEELRAAYARALLWAGRPVDAQKTIKAVPDPEAPLRWLLTQAYFAAGQVDDALAEADNAVTAGVPDEYLAARLRAFAAQCLVLLGQVDAADAVAAAASGPHGWYARAAVQLARHRPADALNLVDRALADLADRVAGPDHQFAPHLVRAFCLLRLDRLADADVACEEGRAGAFLGWYHLVRTRIRFLDGRWDDALAEAEAGLERPDPLGVTETLRSQAALIAMHRGDFTTHGDVLAHRDASLGGRHWAALRLCAHTLAWERAGRSERALDALLDAWAASRAECLAPEIARLAAAVGQRFRARPLADELDRPDAPHLRAMAALCRGIADADPTLLLTTARALGCPLYAGYAYESAAAALAESGEPGPARAALDAAIDCYERLGAAWDVSRAEARLRHAGVRHRHARRPKTGWDSLTETERRVATLVADGRSNPDIAVELFLSRRTVRNHVSRILGKLGLTSRVELAVHTYDRRAP